MFRIGWIIPLNNNAKKTPQADDRLLLPSGKLTDNPGALTAPQWHTEVYKQLKVAFPGFVKALDSYQNKWQKGRNISLLCAELELHGLRDVRRPTPTPKELDAARQEAEKAIVDLFERAKKLGKNNDELVAEITAEIEILRKLLRTPNADAGRNVYDRQGKQYADNVVNAHSDAKKRGWPALKGTTKQKDWAVCLRAKMVEASPGIGDSSAKRITDAKWWIDNRSLRSIDLEDAIKEELNWIDEEEMRNKAKEAE